jgi:hypothetical protein
MEPTPTLPAPQNFERNPNPGNTHGSGESRPDTKPNTGGERTGEGAPTPPQATPKPAPAPQMPQTPPTPPKAQQQPQKQQDDTPAIADDVDVIEKEWVEKAKKIVSSTKDDPRKQEKEVSKLQADYLKKRYGKQVKLTE